MVSQRTKLVIIKGVLLIDVGQKEENGQRDTGKGQHVLSAVVIARRNGTSRTCVTFGSMCYTENDRSRVCHIFDGNFDGTGGVEAELRDFIVRWGNNDPRIKPYAN